MVWPSLHISGPRIVSADSSVCMFSGKGLPAASLPHPLLPAACGEECGQRVQFYILPPLFSVASSPCAAPVSISICLVKVCVGGGGCVVSKRRRCAPSTVASPAQSSQQPARYSATQPAGDSEGPQGEHSENPVGVLTRRH